MLFSPFIQVKMDATLEFHSSKHRRPWCRHIAHVSAADVWAAGFSVWCQKTRQPPASGLQSEPSPFPAHRVVWVYGTRRDAWRAVPGTAPGAWEPLMAAINTSTCLWLHSYVVPQHTTRELTGLTAVSPEPPFDSRPALVRSRCTCSSASRTRYVFYWRTFLRKSGSTTSEH